MNKIGKLLSIRLEDEQRTQLDTLSQQSGHPVAVLIRWCIKNSLPALATKLGVPIESTIDTNSRP